VIVARSHQRKSTALANDITCAAEWARMLARFIIRMEFIDLRTIAEVWFEIIYRGATFALNGSHTPRGRSRQAPVN